MSRNSQTRVDWLTTSYNAQKKALREKDAEIRRLRKALRDLVEETPKAEENDGNLDPDVKMESGLSDADLSSAETGGSDVSIEDADPMWDEGDQVYRCVHCCVEVVHGTCQGCFACYEMDDTDSEDDENALRSICTDDQLLRSSRQTAPRGTTPLLEVDPSQLNALNIAYGYNNRKEEYSQLLARGATRLMCERFSLKYTEQFGIVAWLDEALFDDFAGPAMQDCDRWKVYLGRRLRLAKDDPDGAIFIEELLEEAVLFKINLSTRRSHYETILEEPGIWVTRPRTLGPVTAETKREHPNADPYNFSDMEQESNSSDCECRTYEGALESARNGEKKISTIRNEYEETESASSEDEYEDDSEASEREFLPDEAINAYVDDAPWDSENDSSYDAGTAGDGELSSVDSDFDEDEELSGDELFNAL